MPLIDDETTQLRPDWQVAPDAFFSKGTGGLRASLDELQARLAVPARFEVIEELGRGGMGIVYKVRDIQTCEIVALKILKPEIAGDPLMRENLRKEVCLARKVTHKNVCRIHEFSRSETTACISMEFVDGESLLSKLQRRGALDHVVAVGIARQICEGVHEAHSQGITHRDLKPANVVIAEDKTVKIMDFGVARHCREAAETVGELAGTPAYMSPEQLEMKPVGPATDIYAIGLMLYEMVTGGPAFTSDNPVDLALQHLRQEPPRPSKIAPGIPARLETAILKCLEKDPASRFASAEELSAALEKSIAPIVTPSKPIVNLEPAKAVVQKVGHETIADLRLLGQKIKIASQHSVRVTQPILEKWINQIRAIDWKQLPDAKFQIAGGVAAVFLTATIAWTVAAKHQNQSTRHGSVPAQTALASTSAVDSATSLPAQLPVPEPPSLFNLKEFDFDAKVSSVDADQAPDNTDDVTRLKSTNLAHLTLASVKTSPRRSSPPMRSAGAQSAAAPAPQSTVTADVNELPLEGPSNYPTVLAALEPTSTAKQNAQPQPAIQPGATYLEVGSFNDALWADNAVTKLSQLGFSALAVHKTHLWAQSYHVQVGPYETLAELETAEQQLSAKGFKPRAVK
jgi:serine/threonine protein kinase